jgi:hypothetical protein
MTGARPSTRQALLRDRWRFPSATARTVASVERSRGAASPDMGPELQRRDPCRGGQASITTPSAPYRLPGLSIASRPQAVGSGALTTVAHHLVVFIASTQLSPSPAFSRDAARHALRRRTRSHLGSTDSNPHASPVPAGWGSSRPRLRLGESLVLGHDPCLVGDLGAPRLASSVTTSVASVWPYAASAWSTVVVMPGLATPPSAE